MGQDVRRGPRAGKGGAGPLPVEPLQEDEAAGNPAIGVQRGAKGGLNPEELLPRSQLLLSGSRMLLHTSLVAPPGSRTLLHRSLIVLQTSRTRLPGPPIVPPGSSSLLPGSGIVLPTSRTLLLESRAGSLSSPPCPVRLTSGTVRRGVPLLTQLLDRGEPASSLVATLADCAHPDAWMPLARIRADFAGWHPRRCTSGVDGRGRFSCPRFAAGARGCDACQERLR